MIVMMAVAVATVLGFAMVSASTLQSRTASTSQYTSSAEYLAESGGQLAMYYLQNPSSSPVAMPNGYYPGQTGVTFGSAVPGSADVTVTYDSAKKLYTITSVGKVPTSAGGTITKTLTATAAVVTKFTQTAAVSAANNIKLAGQYFTVNGNLETNGTLNVPSGAKITGTARYRTPLTQAIGTTIGSKAPLGSSDVVLVPTWSTIRDYTGQYTYQGHTYTAQKLTASKLSGVSLPTSSDQTNNPAGIYWYDHSVLLDGNNQINGTIVVTAGNVYINGTTTTITPKTGFPAIVSAGNLSLFAGSQLKANGLVWTGGGVIVPDPSTDTNADAGLLSTLTGILNGLLGGLLGGTTSSSPATLQVSGALLLAGPTPVDSTYKGPITVTYDATKVADPDFSTTNAATIGVRVASWTMN